MIYAITERDNSSIVKIGYTASRDGAVCRAAIRHRMASLQTGTWRELICIAACEGSVARERALHREFCKWHVRGEWFENKGGVAAWVDANRVTPIAAPKSALSRKVETMGKIERRSVSPQMHSGEPRAWKSHANGVTFEWRGKVRAW